MIDKSKLTKTEYKFKNHRVYLTKRGKHVIFVKDEKKYISEKDLVKIKGGLSSTTISVNPLEQHKNTMTNKKTNLVFQMNSASQKKTNGQAKQLSPQKLQMIRNARIRKLNVNSPEYKLDKFEESLKNRLDAMNSKNGKTMKFEDERELYDTLESSINNKKKILDNNVKKLINNNSNVTELQIEQEILEYMSLIVDFVNCCCEYNIHQSIDIILEFLKSKYFLYLIVKVNVSENSQNGGGYHPQNNYEDDINLLTELLIFIVNSCKILLKFILGMSFNLTIFIIDLIISIHHKYLSKDKDKIGIIVNGFTCQSHTKYNVLNSLKHFFDGGFSIYYLSDITQKITFLSRIYNVLKRHPNKKGTLENLDGIPLLDLYISVDEQYNLIPKSLNSTNINNHYGILWRTYKKYFSLVNINRVRSMNNYNSYIRYNHNKYFIKSNDNHVLIKQPHSVHYNSYAVGIPNSVTKKIKLKFNPTLYINTNNISNIYYDDDHMLVITNFNNIKKQFYIIKLAKLINSGIKLDCDNQKIININNNNFVEEEFNQELREELVNFYRISTNFYRISTNVENASNNYQ